MFVGTYRDKVDKETFKRKDQLLQQAVRKTEFFDKGMIEFASEDQLMLAVDNMTGGKEEIERIHTVLENVIERSFKKVDIPAAWLAFSLYIRQKKHRTISLKECEQIAAKFKISPDELQHALWFLHHRVGVLLYYPMIAALKGTVISDIQIVYDSATNLIRNVFTFDKVGLSMSEKFREKGQFSMKDVKKAMLEHTDDLLPLEKLIQLLEYHNIVTTIPSTPSSKDHSVPRSRLLHGLCPAEC